MDITEICEIIDKIYEHKQTNISKYEKQTVKKYCKNSLKDSLKVNIFANIIILSFIAFTLMAFRIDIMLTVVLTITFVSLFIIRNIKYMRSTKKLHYVINKLI